MYVKLQAKLTAKESKYLLTTKVLRQTNIYFELFDKYFDSFAVSFACNFTYIFIFSSVVYKSISRTLSLGCLWLKVDCW